jgi:hypothetical protein
MSTTTVVGVPGPWADTSDLRRALVDQNVLYAGQIALEIGAERGAIVVFRGHDPNLRVAFRAAGAYSSLTEAEYGEIGLQRSCVYLVDEDAGSLEAASRIARLSLALVRAGGLGVKVESAGKAHSPSDWEALFASGAHEADLIDGYVVYVGAQGEEYYSCGMHNLGCPDAVAPSGLSPRGAYELLDVFCRFELIDKPTLNSGETFAAGPDAPTFRLRHESSHFDEDDLFWNEHGAWHLEPT